MNPLESVHLALVALAANKLRSFLTMLGVIIGVGSVIIMISIIQGARSKVVQDFSDNGTNIVFAAYAPKRESRLRGGFEGLTMDDVDVVRRRVTLISSVDPEMQAGFKATRGTKIFTAQGIGATEHYLESNALKIDQGRFIDRDDIDSWAKICIIGEKVKKALFTDQENPIGQTIVVTVGTARVPLVVVGTLKHKDSNGPGGTVDDRMFVPLTAMQKRLNGSRIISSFSARSTRPDNAEEAADQMYAVLKDLHPEQAKNKDFIVDTQEGLLKRLDQVLAVFQIVLGGVGFLSLLVGGIGIMNIMLVTVTERTKEIGIRKAVGAKRRDIMTQFIAESMTVSGVGGIIGCLFGYGVSAAIGAAMGDKLPTFVPLWAAGLGFGFAVGVGMFFGIYPAVRASKLDPIQALRYE